MKILVVDDVKFITVYLKRILEAHQHTVLVAYDGTEAIKLLKANQDIGIVLMDYYMPDMNGLDVYNEVRMFDVFNGIDAIAMPPFLLMSAMVDEDMAETATQMGIKHVMEKPLLPSDLIEKINALKSISASDHGLHLYVADVKGQTHDFMCNMLEDSGHHVHHITRGAEILQKVDERAKVDVVLAEYDLEDMSGPKLFKRMKALQFKILGDQKPGDLIPFLLIVDRLSQDQLKEIREAGIRDVMTKPLDMAQMAEKLSKLNNRNATMNQRKKEPDGVLVIDDVGFNQVMIERMLAPHGVAVFKAASAYEAIDVFKQKSNIKAVVCDLMLPGMDGLDFYSHMKTSGEFNVPEFLLVTASSDTTRINEAKRAGFFDVMMKPLNPKFLADLVMRMVGGQTAQEYQDEKLGSGGPVATK